MSCQVSSRWGAYLLLHDVFEAMWRFQLTCLRRKQLPTARHSAKVRPNNSCADSMQCEVLTRARTHTPSPDPIPVKLAGSQNTMCANWSNCSSTENWFDSSFPLSLLMCGRGLIQRPRSLLFVCFMKMARPSTLVSCEQMLLGEWRSKVEARIEED